MGKDIFLKIAEFLDNFYEKTILCILSEEAETLLLEAINDEIIEGIKIRIKGSQFFDRYDPGNTNTLTAPHHTILNKNDVEIFAVNSPDGTAHHRRHRGSKLSNKVIRYLKKKGVSIPDSGVLEGYEIDPEKYYYIVEVKL